MPHRQDGKDLVIIGSLHLTVRPPAQGLVDELRVMINAVLLGAGKSPFSGLTERGSAAR